MRQEGIYGKRFIRACILLQCHLWELLYMYNRLIEELSMFYYSPRITVFPLNMEHFRDFSLIFYHFLFEIWYLELVMVLPYCLGRSICT